MSSLLMVFFHQETGQSANHAANQQLLDLLVKIAQQPGTWKQIHRVLGT